MTPTRRTIAATVAALLLALTGCTGTGMDRRGPAPAPRLTTTLSPTPRAPQTAAVPAPQTTADPATRAACEFAYARDLDTLYAAKARASGLLQAPGVDPVVRARGLEYFGPTSENTRIRARELQDRYALWVQACLNAGVNR